VLRTTLQRFALQIGRCLEQRFALQIGRRLEQRFALQIGRRLEQRFALQIGRSPIIRDLINTPSVVLCTTLQRQALL